MSLTFRPNLFDGEAVIQAHGRSFRVAVGVARGQRGGWFGHLEVPDAGEHSAFGDAVTIAARTGESVALVLPDGRRGVVEIDDSLWFEGRGPWLA